MLDPTETSEPSEERAATPVRAGHRRASRARDRFSPLWRDTRLRVVAAALVVVAAVAIAATQIPGRPGSITQGGVDHRAANSADASGTAGAKPRPASTKPIPPTPEQVAASTHLPAKLAAALRSWNSGPGGGTLLRIANDVGAALQSGGRKSYATMKSACASLGTSVSAAGTGPPIPDAAMQSKYSAALSVLAKAASDCTSAISVQRTTEFVVGKANPTALHVAQSELGSGITSLAGLRSIISAANAPA